MPIKSICPQCSTSAKVMRFSSPKKLMEHLQSNHQTKPEDWTEQKWISKEEAEKLKEEAKKKKEKKEEEKEDKPKKVEPIRLVYKYLGQCPECAREVDTIMVDLDDEQKAISYCPNCKVQYNQNTVIPIEEQNELS